MTLEMANTLAPSVEIDNTRSTQVTDENGEATFQMKIIRGINNIKVAVICECQDVKSPISKPIILRNSVKRVDFVNSFAIDKSIQYYEDDSGNMIETPVPLDDIYIQVTNWQDHGINDILSNEFSLSIITYEQGTVLVSMNQSNVNQYNDALYTQKTNNPTPQETIQNLAYALMKGAATVGAVFSTELGITQ
jgi:hypothetical protein